MSFRNNCENTLPDGSPVSLHAADGAAPEPDAPDTVGAGNFIHDIIEEDLRADPELKIHTRFPPEPNGYLHIGSAKAIRINSRAAARERNRERYKT